MGPDAILARLAALRAADAPTHGGRVLSYVYDPGRPDLDALAADAARLMQPVNGLDPTVFTSVAVLEREVVAFARELLRGDADVVGSVTSGGTESCLLAVKAARDVWRSAGGEGTPVLLAPVTVHAAFRKAAALFGLRLDLVPVDPRTGTLPAQRLTSRLNRQVALAVVSAPSYPFAALDPVAEVAAACLREGVACHVDACIGGLILPFWDDDGKSLPAWDLSVPGVTSIAADLHKYGYAPKGVSVLLHRGRDRHRAQYFAATDWPGYPVVNPTLLGSKPAGPLAAAWALIQALGRDGYAALAEPCRHATAVLRGTVGRIPGLTVVGDPAGPLFAVAADESVPPPQRVDPHHWADRARRDGWIVQAQPGLAQSDGTHLPHTAHLTVTPVTARHLDQLCATLERSTDTVRGVPAADATSAVAALPPTAARLDSDAALALLHALGVDPSSGTLPESMAPLLAVVEAAPHRVAERLLIELLARVVEP